MHIILFGGNTTLQKHYLLTKLHQDYYIIRHPLKKSIKIMQNRHAVSEAAVFVQKIKEKANGPSRAIRLLTNDIISTTPAHNPGFRSIFAISSS